MTEEKKLEYIARMTENLPVLRARLKLTQKELADLIGISNYSISGMEKGQRKMTWNTFMSLLPVFMGNRESADLLQMLGIYTAELEEMLRLRRVEFLSDDDLEGLSAAGSEAPSFRRTVSNPFLKGNGNSQKNK